MFDFCVIKQEILKTTLNFPNRALVVLIGNTKIFEWCSLILIVKKTFPF